MLKQWQKYFKIKIRTSHSMTDIIYKFNKEDDIAIRSLEWFPNRGSSTSQTPAFSGSEWTSWWDIPLGLSSSTKEDERIKVTKRKKIYYFVEHFLRLWRRYYIRSFKPFSRNFNYKCLCLDMDNFGIISWKLKIVLIFVPWIYSVLTDAVGFTCK